MKQILLAFQFLTIVPVKVSGSVSEKDIARSVVFFPVAGVFQGLLAGCVAFASAIIFPPEITPGLVLLTLILSNGGFHLDGLADTFDAISVKSSGDFESDKEKRLSVMKDSSTGAIGTTAILFVILLKYLSLSNISHFTPFTYYSTLFLMPVISKWTMVVSMFHGKSARADGLGQIFLSRTGLKEVSISTLLSILIFVLPVIFSGHFLPDFQFVFYPVLLAAMYILCRLLVAFFNKKFGGLTGDTLGAISELTETAFLFMVIIWLRLFI
ncbi:MAG: adenosylcobinamide-GDP ribazoletransferase [Nitrospira bacterium HGW-Nitrospira-1]|nr:MAG: adenosylcobinamide-GDP ribazoletransferase [Nitrospira bacterium HGW-Nitrospira-1]